MIQCLNVVNGGARNSPFTTQKRRQMEERFYMSVDALKYMDIGNMKALELLMDANVPPPFYLSVDIVKDGNNEILVAAAMPEYDYKKFVESDTIKRIQESYVNEGGNVLDQEALEQVLYFSLPFFAHESGDPVEKGSSRIGGGTVDGCRIYWSSTRVDDIEGIRKLAKLISK